MSAQVPGISEPPRRVPLGVKLALFNHREITGSLGWTIPAAVCLLLSAIAQPLMGARIALIVVGCACLYKALRHSSPRIRRVRRSLGLMRSGRLTIGRIAACRHAKGTLPMRSFAAFVKDWDDFDRRELYQQGTGCLFRVVAIVFGIPFMLFFVAIVAGKVAQIMGVSVTGLTLQFVSRFIGMTILVTLVPLAFAAVIQLFGLWQFGEPPSVWTATRELPSDVNAFRRELLATKEPAPGRDFPSDDYAMELRCAVEYAGLDRVHAAETVTRFSPRLHRSGVEPLLFRPEAPGEIDLLANFPDSVTLADGEWAPVSAFVSAVSLLVSVAVLALALGALAFEGYWLALR